MASPPKLDKEISRALDLVKTPMALEVLDALGHGQAPQDAAPTDTTPDVIDAAITYLIQLGAVHRATEPDAPVLTPAGEHLLHALEQT